MPTSDNVLTYDFDYHMYVINPDYLKNAFDVDFISREGSLTKAKNLCRSFSQVIYNYIYNHKLKNKRYWEYVLAFDDNLRDVIRKCLIEQALYENESSVSKLQNQIGINFLNGIVISKNDLRGIRRIATAVEDILRNYENGVLINTMVQTYRLSSTVYDYDTMGY
jgi:hypothetical protein